MLTPFVSPNCRVVHVLIWSLGQFASTGSPASRAQLPQPPPSFARFGSPSRGSHVHIPKGNSRTQDFRRKFPHKVIQTGFAIDSLPTTSPNQIPPLQICKTKLFRRNKPKRRLSNEGCHTADPTRKLSNHGFDTVSVSKVCDRPCVSRKKLSLWNTLWDPKRNVETNLVRVTLVYSASVLSLMQSAQ